MISLLTLLKTSLAHFCNNYIRIGMVLFN